MDAIKTTEGGERMRITKCVLWSSAENLNPGYQRLQWAASSCVATSLLPPFAAFVLSDGRSFVVSRTASTQHSSSLMQHRLALWYSKQVSRCNCTNAPGSIIDKKPSCGIKPGNCTSPRFLYQFLKKAYKVWATTDNPLREEKPSGSLYPA